jgi:hypothetical protein
MRGSTAYSTSPQCKAERVLVIAVHGADVGMSMGWKAVTGGKYRPAVYEPGKVTVAHDWTNDFRSPDGNGIFFFRTREEAENYGK